MANKDDDDNDNDDRHDFTSIGDMTEFLHPEDMQAELKFKQLTDDLLPEKEETFPETIIEDLPPDLPSEVLPELSFLESAELSSDLQKDLPIEESFDSTMVADITIGFPSDENSDLMTEEETPKYIEPENFKEVQTFAQNFSYGEIPAGGNPPFSLILNNIKYQEDADSILALLREFKIATAENEKEFVRSIEYGTLLIPQVNEYLAILLTHKFRRFDCEIEMGLSDQIQPSKSGETNPRGLTNKTHLSQNRSEQFEFSKGQVILSEVIISTTPSLVGHKITKYQGVETSFRMIETEDLERLHFIQRSLSEALQNLDNETQSDYSDFTSNFHQIYTDLINELKEKAYKKMANALLGVSFALTPFLTEKQSSQNKYQLTCTATLVNVTKENITEEDETI